VVTRCEPGDPTHRWPEVLPNGEGVLFAVRGGALSQASIAVLSFATGQQDILVEDGTSPHYVPTGHIAYARDCSLQAVPFDLHGMEVTGPAVTVVDNLRMFGAGEGKISISNDGSLVYHPLTLEEIDLVWVDRRGSVSPLSEERRAFDAPRLSPDGRFLAVMLDECQHDLWVLDIARGALTRLTFGRLQDNHNPIWTPDGERVTFSSSRFGRFDLFWEAADGGGTAEVVATLGQFLSAGAWAPDGRTLVFEENHPETRRNIWVVESHGERQPTPFLRTEFDERQPAFSPDGRWLAYTSDETGRDEVYVRSFPGSGAKRQVSAEGGVDPVWNPTGGELFFRSGDQVMVVTVKTQPVLTLSRPRLLFEGPYRWSSSAFGFRNYDVAPDGDRFVILKAPPGATRRAKLHVVLNWFEELKQLDRTD
jgi:Tol biopolymer transport system component